MPTPDHQRRTKIVATIGPATESPDSIRQLILAGATTFRLNFSHGDHEEHAQRAATIRQVAHEWVFTSESCKTCKAQDPPRPVC